MITHFQNFLGPGALCEASFLLDGERKPARSAAAAVTEAPEKVTCKKCLEMMVVTEFAAR
jgi:hypothetical protein